jgi:hypothetical protein
MSDVRQAVEALLARGTKTDSRPTELDVLIAVAALEADEPAVLALLEAEATRRKRPGLDLEAQVDRVAIMHLQRIADAVCELPHAALVATLERIDEYDANAEWPIASL